MAQAIYLEQYQQRQEAAMGFDDDLDFCPSLTSREVREIIQSSATLSRKEDWSRPSRPFHLPLVLSSFSSSASPSSPHSPPLLSPSLAHGSSVQSSPLSAPGAQASRAIPIVDPSSGEAVQLPLNAVTLRSPTATTSVHTASSQVPSRILAMTTMVTAETVPTMQGGYVETSTPFEHDRTSLASSGSEEDSEMGSPLYHHVPGTDPDSSSSFAPFLCFIPEFEAAYFHPQGYQQQQQEDGLFAGMAYEGATGAPGPFFLPSPMFVLPTGSPVAMGMGMSPPHSSPLGGEGGGIPFFSSLPMPHMHPISPLPQPTMMHPEDGSVVSMPRSGPGLVAPGWHQHSFISVR